MPPSSDDGSFHSHCRKFVWGVRFVGFPRHNACHGQGDDELESSLLSRENKLYHIRDFFSFVT